MKQLIHSYSTGITEIIEVPVPKVKDNFLLIKSSMSLLSTGTEKMLVEFGKANYIGKAKQQPERVKGVIDKVISDGILATAEAVKSKLENPVELGYSNIGIVLEIGKSVKGFSVGDRVISNGPHAEIFIVSANLCAKVPENITNETAVFTVVASIGLQGIRLANPSLGETFLVSGLGLIGLLTIQLLKANGCKVLGIDTDNTKCKIAESFGIETFNLSNENNPIDWCLDKTKGNGVDGALITASTSSSQPLDIAASACRKKGRIISIGVTGLNLKRELFYKKELSFQVSCSYGPGRYDKEYEEKGNDYPLPFVRWTEKRNFEAILNSMENGLINVKPLISSFFDFKNATAAYDLLMSKEKTLGIIFKYSQNIDKNETIKLVSNIDNFRDHDPIKAFVSFIGSGNYASRKLIPAFKKAKAEFYSLSANKGLSPAYIGRKFRFEYATTNVDSILNDKKCNSVVIATRHDSHADLVNKSLLNGKNVFVEKPLCINLEQLNSIEETYKNVKNSCEINDLKNPILMVGFNRRFAPLILLLKKKLIDITTPKAFIYNINAGSITQDHWINHPNIGGGRLIGEAIHFVDLLRFLVSDLITDLSVNFLKDNHDLNDSFSINISFNDGSLGVVNYFSNGSRSFPKERLEVFAEKKIFQLNNFRSLKTWGLNHNLNKRYFYQDKGQNNCAKSFINAVKFGKLTPIPISEIFEVQRHLLLALKNV